MGHYIFDTEWVISDQPTQVDLYFKLVFNLKVVSAQSKLERVDGPRYFE